MKIAKALTSSSLIARSFQSVSTGIEIAAALHQLFPAQWKIDRTRICWSTLTRSND